MGTARDKRWIPKEGLIDVDDVKEIINIILEQ